MTRWEITVRDQTHPFSPAPTPWLRRRGFSVESYDAVRSFAGSLFSTSCSALVWREAAAEFPLEVVHRVRGVENPCVSQFG